MISSIFLVMVLQQERVFTQVATGSAATAPGHQESAHRVVPGDTLSKIAPTMDESWQQLYAANQSVIGANPNLIYPGEVLHSGGATRTVATHTTSAKVTRWSHARHLEHLAHKQALADQQAFAAQQAAAPAPQPQAQAQTVQQQQPVQQAAPQRVSVSGGSYESCVISRESGGDPNVWNPSGHWGLFQFAASTWSAAGGNPADFGHASAAEQEQVFNVAYAKWGTQPWSPSDGC